MARVSSLIWLVISFMACMELIWTSWFIMSVVSAWLSMVWFWNWATIRPSMSVKERVDLSS